MVVCGSGYDLTLAQNWREVTLLDLMEGNYWPNSTIGCHIAHSKHPETLKWLVSHEHFDAASFGLESAAEAPDISIDPEDGLLSVINSSSHAVRSFFITIEGRVESEKGIILDAGAYSDGEDIKQCITFVLVLAPMHVMDVAFVQPLESGEYPALESDIKDLEEAAQSLSTKTADWPSIRFPLSGECGPYRCSQGHGGLFTHFYPATLYAVDLDCPVGTNVLAAGDGVVMEIKQDEKHTGIHTSNLYRWNSVMLALDSGIFVEYVHIAANSCPHQVGDRVQAGDVLCTAGDVGFCPTPHLHLQVHLDSASDALTVPFCFKSIDGDRRFVPQASKFYGPTGEVDVAMD